MSFGGRGPKTANRKAHLKKGKAEKKKSENNELIQLIEKAAQAEVLGKDAEKFSQLPISQRTLRGLEGAHFVDMTDIQKVTIPVALAGKDVLGAAKTGSGKTLAFLIPLLEKLYREKWSPYDGLGALVLSPTRELALQTFEVLRRIGKYHTLSAGLVIGGKDLKAERMAIGRMNILIATPGRLLQHFDQTQDFDWSNLQMLVLDEADRILDLGFARTIDAIVATLPRCRQTLLFSATQSSTPIQDLARLSLSPSATTISMEKESTPTKLEQFYLCCPLSEKMDRLFSFIKGHLKQKTIVFFASCKEVRFVYEAFCKLQPGVPLMHLHGRQKQMKRVEIFHDFCRKPHAVLFATDIAARGLDFPAVDWVLQVDCPEDVETYIHRVGRTARFQSEGKALLLLCPSERDGMVKAFEEKSIPIKSLYSESRPLPTPKRTCRSQLQALCSQDPEIKYLAQKALISYVKSVHLNGNKSVFQVKLLQIDEFALSLGLAGTPKLRFVSRAAKNLSRDQQAQIADSSEESQSEEVEKQSVKEQPSKQLTKLDKMFKKKNQNILSEHYSKLRDNSGFDDSKDDADEDDGELLVVKRRDHEIDLASLPAPAAPTHLSRRDLLKTKKKYLLKTNGGRSHVRFMEGDNEGEEEGLVTEDVLPFTPESHFDRLEADKLADQFVAEETEHMKEVDPEDAERLKEFRKKKWADKKRKQLEAAHNASIAKAPRLE